MGVLTVHRGLSAGLEAHDASFWKAVDVFWQQTSFFRIGLGSFMMKD